MLFPNHILERSLGVCTSDPVNPLKFSLDFVGFLYVIVNSFILQPVRYDWLESKMQPVSKILRPLVVDEKSSALGLENLLFIQVREFRFLVRIVFLIENVLTLFDGFLGNELRSLHSENLEETHYFICVTAPLEELRESDSGSFRKGTSDKVSDFNIRNIVTNSKDLGGGNEDTLDGEL